MTKVWHYAVVFAVALLAIWVVNKNFFGVGTLVGS
jgi:hypothetical protein